MGWLWSIKHKNNMFGSCCRIKVGIYFSRIILLILKLTVQKKDK